VNFPTLTKSQRVTDPNGSTNPVPNAIVTYTIVADIASGTVTDAVVSDIIPPGTTYEPNSISVSNAAGVFAALTDADDADAGRAASGAIAVKLGELRSGSPRSVRFRVKINP